MVFDIRYLLCASIFPSTRANAVLNRLVHGPRLSSSAAPCQSSLAALPLTRCSSVQRIWSHSAISDVGGLDSEYTRLWGEAPMRFAVSVEPHRDMWNTKPVGSRYPPGFASISD